MLADDRYKIKFFYMSDLNQCPDRQRYNQITNVVMNLHTDGWLVYDWKKTGMRRYSHNPLPPGEKDKNGLEMPQFYGYIDTNAPIRFSPSLKRERQASIFNYSNLQNSSSTIKERKPKGVKDSHSAYPQDETISFPVVSSDIQSAFSQDGKIVNARVSVTAIYDGNAISYRIERTPQDIIVVIGDLPKAFREVMSYEEYNNFLSRLPSSNVVVEIGKMMLGKDDYRSDELFNDDVIIVHSRDNAGDQVEAEGRATAEFTVKATAAEVRVVPLAILSFDREPIIKGMTAVYMPQGADAASLLIAGNEVQDLTGEKVGKLSGVLTDPGGSRYFIVRRRVGDESSIVVPISVSEAEFEASREEVCRLSNLKSYCGPAHNKDSSHQVSLIVSKGLGDRIREWAIHGAKSASVSDDGTTLLRTR
jgi:hypothetical protein